MYPSSHTIAKRGSVASISRAVTMLTARPISSVSIRGLDMHHRQSFGDQDLAVVRVGLLKAMPGSGSNDRINAVSGQFGNDGQRTHSFQMR